MVFNINDLLKIENIDNYNLTFNRKSSAIGIIYTIYDKKIHKNYNVTKNYLMQLKNMHIAEVSINTNRKFLQKVRELFPEKYPKPDGEENIVKLFQIATEYEIMNMKSEKKRYITILEDVYSEHINFSLNEKELLIEYGTRLNSKLKAKVKKDLNPVEKVYYKDSEKGVLVFVPEAKNFKLKVDLFAILSTLGEIPIYDANDAKDALNIYKTKSPKLVILGKLSSNIESKKAFLYIEEYDPYVKKLNYEESPASNREFETKRIRNNYFSGYTKILELEKREKDLLPEEIKNTILEIIQKLQNNFSMNDYIEAAYAIKQFGRMFNVTTYWHMLQNVKKRHMGY